MYETGHNGDNLLFTDLTMYLIALIMKLLGLY